MCSANVVMVYTDGSCLGNPGPGGWAALLVMDGREKMLQGGAPDTTNNRMEMQAVIEGLSALKRQCVVTLVTDSKYVMQGVMEWMPKWKLNGWKTAAKKPVKNVDLWQALDKTVSEHQVSWEWVKGHAGHPENERVDEAARLMAEQESRS